jgi:hypothetical protein
MGPNHPIPHHIFILSYIECTNSCKVSTKLCPKYHHEMNNMNMTLCNKCKVKFAISQINVTVIMGVIDKKIMRTYYQNQNMTSTTNIKAISTKPSM